MNKLALRAWFTLALAGILLAGMCVIVVRYMTDGSDWVSFRSNPAVQIGGALSSYSVVTRDGVTILDTSQKPIYGEDAALRSSLLHLLGDGGNVSSHLIDEYGSALTGYHAIGGVYSTDHAQGELELTVSATAQKAAYHAMNGKKGAVGVYNYQTGEVLCMLSMPTYDPQEPPDSIYTTDTEGNLVVKEEYDGVYFNRFLWSTYIPGSTYKIVTAAAAIEKIEDIETRTFECTGSALIGGKEAACHSADGHGTITFNEAFAKSCNVAFAQISVELGREILLDFTNRTRITESLRFDGLKTSAGGISLDTADDYAVAWAGIGQAYDQINLCQFMTFVGAIANGGKSAEPYVVSQVRYGNDVQYEAQRQMQMFLSKSTADRLAQMMCYAVDTNYIWSCNFAGLKAGGKSGTAERDGGIQDALFAGFSADADYPLAFVVMIEGGGSGSQACLPIVQQVLNACVAAMDAE